MATNTELFTPPTALQRMVRKTAEIALGRLTVGRAFTRLPLFPTYYTRHLLQRRDHTGLYSGVYASYADALAEIPPNRLAGWDHQAAAQLWVEQIDPIRLSTYPVFFWLHRLVDGNTTVLDVGGSIGPTYYGYRRLAAFPATATWTVVEVPSIALQGARIALRENAANLAFVSELGAAPCCDLLVAAGSLQYMQNSVPGLLEALQGKPRHILVNKVPLTSRRGCWTLQNYGPAISPQQLFNETEFLEYFAGHGYRVRDRWQVEDLDCVIPFHPEYFIRHFSGVLFERDH